MTQQMQGVEEIMQPRLQCANTHYWKSTRKAADDPVFPLFNTLCAIVKLIFIDMLVI